MWVGFYKCWFSWWFMVMAYCFSFSCKLNLIYMSLRLHFFTLENDWQKRMCEQSKSFIIENCAALFLFSLWYWVHLNSIFLSISFCFIVFLIQIVAQAHAVVGIEHLCLKCSFCIMEPLIYADICKYCWHYSLTMNNAMDIFLVQKMAKTT